jgi:glycosyltransferase involved in cell wall biosynthesis
VKTPLVSIITVVRNGEDCIEATIKSVVSQSYPNIEYVVIDGLSTDNTSKILDRYKDKIAYYISEPDKGIADAWNKGIKACTGDIIGILNAGDYLPIDYVATIVENISTDAAVLCYGNTKIVDDVGATTKSITGRFNPKNLANGVGFLHPGCFATRKAYDLVGNFKLSYRLAMDCDWIFRCYRAKVEFKKLEIAALMLGGGMSHQSNLAAYGEYLQSMRDNGFPPATIYTSMLNIAVRGFIKSFVNV